MGPVQSFAVCALLHTIQRLCFAVQQGNFLATHWNVPETPQSNRVEYHESKPSLSTSQVNSLSALPRNGKVAIVLRGEAFRGEELCDTGSFSWNNQISATNSLVSKILHPLQFELNNEVDVVFSESSGCQRDEMLQKLVEIIGKSRVMGFSTFYAANQANSIRGALTAFEHFLWVEHRAIESYDLVLVTRQDSFYKVPFPQWPGNFAQLNSPSYCIDEMRRDPYFGEQCLDDKFHILPGRLYRPFRDVVRGGGNSCFTPGRDTAGHLCFLPFQDAVRPSGSGADVLADDPGKLVRNYDLSPTKNREEVKRHLMTMRPLTFGNSSKLPASFQTRTDVLTTKMRRP